MKEGECVNVYFARTLAIANKMTAHGERKDETLIVGKKLRPNTSRFNYVMCSIEESNDVTKLSIDELKSSLLVQEARKNSHKENVWIILKPKETNFFLDICCNRNATLCQWIHWFWLQSQPH